VWRWYLRWNVDRLLWQGGAFVLFLGLAVALLFVGKLWSDVRGGHPLPAMDAAFWRQTFPGYDFWHHWMGSIGHGALPGSRAFNDAFSGYVESWSEWLLGLTFVAFVWFSVVRSTFNENNEPPIVFVPYDEMNRSCVLWAVEPLASVLLSEWIIVDLEGRRGIVIRNARPGDEFECVEIGDKLSCYEGNLITEQEARAILPELKEKCASLLKQRNMLQEQHLKRIAAAEAEAARLKAEAEKQARIASCGFDNWTRDAREPLTATLPPEWAPFTMGGIACANVVPYGSEPAEQRWNEIDKR
jgi:hypothetical protein